MVSEPAFHALCFLLALMWVAAIGRIAVRSLLVKRLGWDDAAMVATLLLSSAFICMVLATYLYTGLQRIDQLPWDQVYPTVNMVLAILVLYIISSVFLKIALATLLLRVLYVRWQRNVIYGTMAISIAYGTFYWLYVMLECGSPANFHERIIQGHCLTHAQIDGPSYVHAAWNALADLIFLLLPVALLWNQDMTMREKASIAAILGVGSVGSVATIVRIPYINTLTAPTVAYLQTSKTIAVLSGAELSIGVTCICLATFKPLVQKISAKLSSMREPHDTAYCVACGRGDHVAPVESEHLASAHDHSTIQKHQSFSTVNTYATKKQAGYGEYEFSPMSPASSTAPIHEV